VTIQKEELQMEIEAQKELGWDDLHSIKLLGVVQPKSVGDFSHINN